MLRKGRQCWTERKTDMGGLGGLLTVEAGTGDMNGGFTVSGGRS